MSPETAHPSDADIANLADEKIGAKKTQRIIEHCKQCPECAERLLDAVSRRPVAGDGLRLSRWNWISIGVLVAALLAAFGLLIWVLRGPSLPPQPPPTEPVFLALGALGAMASPEPGGRGLASGPAGGPAADVRRQHERECMRPMHYPCRDPGSSVTVGCGSERRRHHGASPPIPRRSPAACGKRIA